MANGVRTCPKDGKQYYKHTRRCAACGECLDIGHYTRELTKIVPLENLNAYWSMYQTIKRTEGEVESLPAVHIDLEISDIMRSTERMENAGLLPKATTIEIVRLLLKGVVQAPKGPHYARRKKRNKIGSPRDAAHDFLIHALAFDTLFFAKKSLVNGKPEFERIAGFLKEQGVTPRRAEEWTGDTVRQKFNRIIPHREVDIFEMLRDVHAIEPFKIKIPEKPLGFLMWICHDLKLKESPLLSILDKVHPKPQRRSVAVSLLLGDKPPQQK